MVYILKNAFQTLIKDSIDNFYKNIDNGFIIVNVDNKDYQVSYKELEEKNKIKMLKKDKFGSKLLRDFIANYILYFIPFDGKRRVLTNDPALYDLHPDYNFIKLNKEETPEEIEFVNFFVKNAYALMFKSVGKYLNLDEMMV